MIKIRINKQNHLFFDCTTSNSLSSLLLLNSELRSQDVDYLKSNWQVQLLYNVEFLKNQKKLQGKLNCSYCHKEDLYINEDFSKNPNKYLLATVDHVVPISKGGDKFDYSNMVVACWKCNNKKKDLIGYKITENKYSF